MAVLSLYVDHPLENANRLRLRLDSLVDDKTCASWMLGGGSGAGRYLLTESSARVETMAEATKLFHALAGAHFLESAVLQWRTCGPGSSMAASLTLR